MTVNRLIVAPGDLGDGLMAVPAVQQFQRKQGNALTILSKPHVTELWQRALGPDRVISYGRGSLATLTTVQSLRRQNFQEAYVLAESFRSAFLPFLAGIPKRIGRAGHSRDPFLTKILKEPSGPTIHRTQVYHRILTPGQHLCLNIPIDFPYLRESEPRHGAPSVMGLFPGAGRGSSKIWPIDRYAKVMKNLRREHPESVFLIFGSNNERRLGQFLARTLPIGVKNLCGQTSLTDLMILLRSCRVVLGNDSGGVHLASALGVPVVAIFGMTNPDRTRPMGPQTLILQRSKERSEAIPKKSRRARAALDLIHPLDVVEAMEQFL